MSVHHTILVAACVSFAGAVVGVPVKIDLVALGLFCFALSWFW